MQTAASPREGKDVRHKWGAALCLLVAYLSPTKFPGLSGWLGASGFLLLSAVIFTTPEFAANDKRNSRIPTIKYVLIFLALSLVVASVIVWSVER